MKKWLIIILIAFFVLTAEIGWVYGFKEDQTGYLIIHQNFCVIVRSPKKQLTTSAGKIGLDIILKDKTTRVMMSGGYIAIAVPVSQIEAAIKKYHLQNMTFIE